MIQTKVDRKEWRREFNRRFTHFAENSPLVLTYDYDDLRVRVSDSGSGLLIDRDFDFSLSVSDFIHDIKTDLLPYYPTFLHRVETLRPITNEEVVNRLLKGIPISEIPEEVVDVVFKYYRVDKYIPSKNLYCLTLLPDNTSEKYLIEPFGVFFIKNYREGKYRDEKEAGEAFFKRAVKVEK